MKTYKVQYFEEFDNNSLLLNYEQFGNPSKDAPKILIFHALTGNSSVCESQNSWWSSMVGKGKTIDTDKFQILAPNFIGNGYKNQSVTNAPILTIHQLAKCILQWLLTSGFTNLHSVFGLSVGGGLAWELIKSQEIKVENYFLIASDWISSPWIKGFCKNQLSICQSQDNGHRLAREISMPWFRNPESFDEKFKLDSQDTKSNVESWLSYHGRALEARMENLPYQQMVRYLSSITVWNNKEFEAFFRDTKLNSNIIQIGISSDILFSAKSNQETHKFLTEHNHNSFYFEIDSIHGHDAFLIEHHQLSYFITSFLNDQNL